MDRIIQNVLLLLISLTPFFGITEGLTVIGYDISISFVFIKALKLGIIFLIFILSILRFLSTDFKYLKVCVIVFLLFFFTLITFLLSSNLYIALAGVNWSIMFFLIFLFVGVINVKFLHKLSKVLVFILIANTVLQIMQMFYMPASRGANFFGLSGRLAGFYSSASSAGILAAFIYFSIKYFSNFNNKFKTLFLGICVLSAFLSMSSTGVGLLFFIIVYPFYLKSKNKIFAFIVFVPVILWGITNLDALTGRTTGSSESSISTRFYILKNQIESSEIISTKFGEATNMAVSMNSNLNIYSKGVFISDMMYTSMLVNYGWFITLIFLGIVFVNVVNVFRLNYVSLKLFVIMCLLSSTSLIIAEIFPINILVAIYLSYYILKLNNPKYRYNASNKISKMNKHFVNINYG